MIVTNPPFGGMEEDGIENNFPTTFRTRETADLFLVLIMHLLKDGGRAAVVLPDGTLFGEGIKNRASRNSCWKPATCTPSCACPTASSTPTPASRPTCSSSPRAARPPKPGSTNTPIPLATRTIPRPGPCASRNSRSKRHGGEGLRGSERVENEFAWKVSADDIKARNYNLDIKNPHSPDQINHDPDELLADYAQLQQRIAATRDQLKAVLAAALEGKA